MTYAAVKAIVLSELNMVEEELTTEQRISLAIEITIRLMSIAVEHHN